MFMSLKIQKPILKVLMDPQRDRSNQIIKKPARFLDP